jgi:lipopolysaccharide export system protein LptC
MSNRTFILVMIVIAGLGWSYRMNRDAVQLNLQMAKVNLEITRTLMEKLRETVASDEEDARETGQSL